MKIEAVIVSVNYGDFLAWTLPTTRHCFEGLVVVTHPTDRHTVQVCAHYNVKCIQTDQFYHDNVAFDKAAGINYGLEALSLSDWVVHLDADIALPPRAREMIHMANLEPDCIYGIDRMMCPTFEEYAAYLTEPEVMHDDEVFVKFNAFEAGVRIARLEPGGQGYVPIGFFQLWNAGATGIKDYPDRHGTASRTDMLHALRWPRAKRHLIPEIVGVHLDSEASAHAANWRGRVTAPFGIPGKGRNKKHHPYD